MNLYAIISGWRNFIDRSDVTECVALKRAKICEKCPEAKQGKLLSVVKDDVMEIDGYYCNLCKCPLSAKVRQDVEICPKWL
jgi:hypothetical protein